MTEREVTPAETNLRNDLIKNQTFAEKYVKPPMKRPLKAKEHITKAQEAINNITKEALASIAKLTDPEARDEASKAYNDELFIFYWN